MLFNITLTLLQSALFRSLSLLVIILLLFFSEFKTSFGTPCGFETWVELPQTLPDPMKNFGAVIVDNTMYVLGDESDKIYVLHDANVALTCSNDDLWYEFGWPSNEPYGSVNQIVMYNSYVLNNFNSNWDNSYLLYIISAGYESDNNGEMFIYDLTLNKPVNASTYQYGMPIQYWETPCMYL